MAVCVSVAVEWQAKNIKFCKPTADNKNPHLPTDFYSPSVTMATAFAGLAVVYSGLIMNGSVPGVCLFTHSLLANSVHTCTNVVSAVSSLSHCVNIALFSHYAFLLAVFVCHEGRSNSD